MCEATYFYHIAAEHALMASVSLDVKSRTLKHALAADYGDLARLLRLSRSLGDTSERELEAALLDR